MKRDFTVNSQSMNWLPNYASESKEELPALVIVGAGQHGRVVLSNARACGFFGRFFFIDDRRELAGLKIQDAEVIGSRDRLGTEDIPPGAFFFLGIGDIAKRIELERLIRDKGYRFATIINPSANIGYGVSIGEGTLIEAGCLVAAGAVIGANVIMNPGAAVNHDNKIGDFVHLAGGVVLGGNVSIGDRTLIGVGSVVASGVKIGSDVRCSAGALVMRDVPDGSTVLARPSLVIRGGWK